MPEDKKIIKRFKEGDAEAFDTIYRNYSKKMFHFALGLVKNQEIAKDLVQEVFVSLWEKRGQVNLNLNFDNYVFTIAYNSIRKFFRKKAIETKAIDHLLKDSPGIIESVDGTIIYNELLELANKTIENLPPKRKIVYKLSRQEGMKIKEIAGRMNISTRTAENHLAKALKYLKEELTGISLLMLLFFFLFLK
ncbi:MAG: RNA polymerase sigma-70 factor [Bacteroidota bacterium]